jgi:hypothetical protein
MYKWFEHILRTLLPHWRDNGRADPTHPHRRRYTKRYRRKVDMVKSLWIGSGLIMLLCNSLALILGLALATTFLSFVVLDETA